MDEKHVVRIHTAPVVMDIGADRGGLIIYTEAERCGQEIEVSPKADATQRVHTDVVERQVNGRSIFAAVYLPFPAGEYTIWGPDPRQPTAVVIVAATVTEIDWRSTLPTPNGTEGGG